MPDFTELLPENWVPIAMLVVGIAGVLVAWLQYRRRGKLGPRGDDNSIRVDKATTGSQSPQSIGSGDSQTSYGSGDNVKIEANTVTIQSPAPAHGAHGDARLPTLPGGLSIGDAESLEKTRRLAGELAEPLCGFWHWDTVASRTPRRLATRKYKSGFRNVRVWGLCQTLIWAAATTSIPAQWTRRTMPMAMASARSTTTATSS